MSDFIADFKLEKQKQFDAEFRIDIIPVEHSNLKGRDKKDQHPISAITGLEESLNNISQQTELLEAELQNEIDQRTNADSELSDKIDNVNNELTKDISDLTDIVESNYSTLDSKIDTTSQNINKRITDVADEINQTIEENVVALQQADTNLQSQITTNTSNISQEIIDRQNADSELSDKIEDNKTNIENLVGRVTTNEQNIVTLDENKAERSELQAEITNRENADKELSDKIDTVEDDLTEDIEALTTIVENNYTTLDNRITEVASELEQSIEENVVALQQEDTALQNQINTHSTTLTAYDTRITNNANAISQEIIDRQDADDNLQEQIDNLKARGRFLSLWNATTGLAETNPEIDPYPYNTGDYFIVGVVGETNYKPTGTQYVIGQASTVVETEELATEDVYYFDGQVWHLQVNHGKTVSFGNLAGQPSDNIALKNALDSKQDVITDLNTIRDNASKVIYFNYNDVTYNQIKTAIDDNKIVKIIHPGFDYIICDLVSVLSDRYKFSYTCDPDSYIYDILVRNDDFKQTTYRQIELRSNKTTLITSTSTDTQYPSAKAVYDNLITKQDTLVSGTNIKTLNNESLLGSGDIDITSAQWGNITGDIENQTDLKTALDNKQDLLTQANAGDNITITAGSDVPIAPLPDGYIQLEYIESSGIQCIALESTTYNRNDIVEIDYEFTSFVGSYPTIFGSGDSEIYTDINGNVLTYNNIEALEPTKYQLYSKQTTIGTFTKTITTIQCISAYWQTVAPTYYSRGRIYGFRHKRGEDVLKNLIPAIETSTNNIGMYDIVNNTFINGYGDNQFIAGNVVSEVLKISADVPVKDVQMNNVSVVENNIANIPTAGQGTLGVINGGDPWNSVAYVNKNAGWGTGSVNSIFIRSASNAKIDNRQGDNYGNGVGVIKPDNLDYAVKVAMCDGKGAAWTDDEKANARDRMGVTSELSTKQDLLTPANAGNNITITTGSDKPIVPLPVGYTQLEYIESTGTQNINTNIVMNQTNNYSIDLKFSNIINVNGTLFGAQNGDKRTFCSYGGNIYCGNGTNRLNYSNSINTSDVFDLRADWNSLTNNLSIFVNNNQIASGVQDGLFSENTLHFLNTNGGSGISKAICKVYSFKITENDIIILNFIPAKRNSDSVIGMYDLVTNQFFTNAGTGEFISGGIISNILKISADLSSKQDVLISGTNIKTLNNESLLGSGNIDITSAQWGNISGDIENQTDLQESLQNVREVAEGKTKSYVVSYTNNPIFNSQDAEIKLTDVFIDINGNTHNIDELKLGDNIFVQETDVPDRWCSQPSEGENKSVTFYKLETSKVDLTEYATKTELANKQDNLDIILLSGAIINE